MIRFRRWAEHNRRALKDIVAKRRTRGIPENAPLSLAKVIVATHLDGDFARFAKLVGGRSAETFLLRSLQYAAEVRGGSGELPVEVELFGPVVLTRPWDAVSVKTGKLVYEALLASKICVLSADVSAPLSGDQSADKEPSPSADVSAPMARPPSPSPSTPPYAPPLRPVRGPLPDGVAVHGGYEPIREPPRDAIPPGDGAKRLLGALRPPPERPIRGKDPEPEPPRPTADPAKIEALKAETLARIAALDERNDDPQVGRMEG